MERITKLLEAPEILSNNKQLSMSDEVEEEAIDDDALVAEWESSVAAEDDNPDAVTVEPAGTRVLNQNEIEGLPCNLPLCLRSRPQLPRPSSQGARAGFFRVLPVTIFLAAFALSMKPSDIWNGITGELPTGATMEVARSLAQLAPGAGNEAAPGDAATEAQAPEMAPPSHSTGITAASATDPISLSQPESELLLALAVRREQLAERERDVEQREALLSALEKWDEQQIASLKDAQKRISALMEKQKTAQNENMQRMVKVYEIMKPKAAARIFEKMEKRVLLRVAARMKEAKLAPILALMNPVKVNEVIAELVRRRELLRPPGLVLDFAEILVEAHDVDR